MTDFLTDLYNYVCEHTPKIHNDQKASDALARRGFSWPEISDALRRYGMEVWD